MEDLTIPEIKALMEDLTIPDIKALIKIKVMESIEKRSDIFMLITEGKNYHDIIGLFPDASKTGFVFETISIICIIFKQLIPDYEFISDTNIEDTNLLFKPIESVRELFNQNIN